LRIHFVELHELFVNAINVFTSN